MGQPNLPKMNLAIGRYAKRSNCQKPTSLFIQIYGIKCVKYSLKNHFHKFRKI